MYFVRHILQPNLLKRSNCIIIFSAGLKNIKRPPNYDHIILPEKRRLPVLDKIPQFIGAAKTPRVSKLLHLMRGPELVHNTLLLGQYGVIALRGGRLNFRHLETTRYSIMKTMDIRKMFAIWRVDAPWQPVTKKGLGQRMGGGKGTIDHYVTPIRQGRVIIELGGHIEYKEALPILKNIVARLPFPAIPVNVEILENMKKAEERERTENTNPYTMEYCIKNNMGNCRQFISSQVDFQYFGKYL